MSNRGWTILVVALAGVVALAVALAGGAEEQEDAPAPTAPATTAEAPPPDEPPLGDRRPDRKDPDPDPTPDEVEEGPSGPPPSSDPEREAARTLRAYVRALDEGRGERLCRLFAPGALDGFEWPRDRGDCSASLEASLGYRDPRGLPVWESSEATDELSATVTGESARVVATIVTLYRDVREPTIEDDIVYLRRSEDRWLIVKPSATLYRAVGIAEIPPSVIAPPG